MKVKIQNISILFLSYLIIFVSFYFIFVLLYSPALLFFSNMLFTQSVWKKTFQSFSHFLFLFFLNKKFIHFFCTNYIFAALPDFLIVPDWFGLISVHFVSVLLFLFRRCCKNRENFQFYFRFLCTREFTGFLRRKTFFFFFYSE